MTTPPRSSEDVRMKGFAQRSTVADVLIWLDGQTSPLTAEAVLLREAAGRVFNIGSDREMSINELVRLIRRLTGSDSEITHVPYASVFGPNFEDLRRRAPDVNRAREVLGFEAQTPFEEGLQRTLAWFREDGREE